MGGSLEAVQEPNRTVAQVLGEVFHVVAQVAQGQQTEPGAEEILIEAQQVLVLIQELKQPVPVAWDTR